MATPSRLKIPAGLHRLFDFKLPESALKMLASQAQAALVRKSAFSGAARNSLFRTSRAVEVSKARRLAYGQSRAAVAGARGHFGAGQFFSLTAAAVQTMADSLREAIGNEYGV